MKRVIFLLFLFVTLTLSATQTQKGEKGFILSFDKEQEYYVYFAKNGIQIKQSDMQYFQTPDIHQNNPTLELDIKYCLPNYCTLRLMFTAQPDGATDKGKGFMLVRDEVDETTQIKGVNYYAEVTKSDGTVVDFIDPDHPKDTTLTGNYRAKELYITNRVIDLYNTWNGSDTSSVSYTPGIENTDSLYLEILPFAEQTSNPGVYEFTSGVFYGYAYLILQMK